MKYFISKKKHVPKKLKEYFNNSNNNKNIDSNTIHSHSLSTSPFTYIHSFIFVPGYEDNINCNDCIDKFTCPDSKYHNNIDKNKSNNKDKNNEGESIAQYGTASNSLNVFPSPCHKYLETFEKYLKNKENFAAVPHCDYCEFNYLDNKKYCVGQKNSPEIWLSSLDTFKTCSCPYLYNTYIMLKNGLFGECFVQTQEENINNNIDSVNNFDDADITNDLKEKSEKKSESNSESNLESNSESKIKSDLHEYFY